jgi:hypothetical protein
MSRVLLFLTVTVCACGRSGVLISSDVADMAVPVAAIDDMSIDRLHDMYSRRDMMRHQRDLAVATDLATPMDLSTSLDFAAEPDLAIAIDMTTPFDLAIPTDLSKILDMSRRQDLATMPRTVLDFSSPQSFAAGVPPATGFGIAAGDFNGDYQPDIVSANWGNNYTGSLSVLLGRGDGTLAPPTNLYAGGGPFNVAVADINGDGNQDLISSADSLWCFFGRGDGTWQMPATSYQGSLSLDAIIADLNNDGLPDIVTVEGYTPGDVRVYMGIGGGLLSPGNRYTAGTASHAGTVGMFSRTGARGIVVADRGDATGTNASVQVLMIQPDGTLGPAIGYLAHDSAYDVVAADFNLDGIDDIVVAEASGGIGVYLAKGDGTFAAESHFGGGSTPYAIVAGDFNTDGRLDVATANAGYATVDVRLGAGDGTFDVPHTFAIGHQANDLIAVDLNGDGLPDIATSNADATVTVLLNRSH